MFGRLDFSNLNQQRVSPYFFLNQNQTTHKCNGPAYVQILFPNTFFTSKEGNQQIVHSSNMSYATESVLSLPDVEHDPGGNGCVAHATIPLFSEHLMYVENSNGKLNYNYSYGLPLNNFITTIGTYYTFQESYLYKNAFKVMFTNEKSKFSGIEIDTDLFANNFGTGVLFVNFPSLTITRKADGVKFTKNVNVNIDKECLSANQRIQFPFMKNKCLMKKGKLLIDKEYFVKSIMCTQTPREPYFICGKTDVFGNWHEDNALGDPNNYEEEIIATPIIETLPVVLPPPIPGQPPSPTPIPNQTFLTNFEFGVSNGEARPGWHDGYLDTSSIDKPRSFNMSFISIKNACSEKTPLGAFQKMVREGTAMRQIDSNVVDADYDSMCRTYYLDANKEKWLYNDKLYCEYSKKKDELPQWKERYTIGDKGCLLTAMANAATAITRAAAGSDFYKVTPIELNDWLNKNAGYYNTNKTNPGTIITTQLSQFPSKTSSSIRYKNRLATVDELATAIDQCEIPIVAVKNCYDKDPCTITEDCSTHFVMAYDYDEDNDDNLTFKIHDPGYSSRNTLGSYCNSFTNIHKFLKK